MKQITGTPSDSECACDAHAGHVCVECFNAYANGITYFFCRQDFYEYFSSGARNWHTKCSIWDDRPVAPCITCGHIQALEFQTNTDCGMCSEAEPTEIAFGT